MDLYERLIELLGKSDNNPLFDLFLSDFGVPEFDSKSKEPQGPVRACFFHKLGVDILFDRDRDCCTNVFFHINPAEFHPSDIIPYAGPFPSGITIQDQRHRVEQKLRMRSDRSTIQGSGMHSMHSDRYAMAGYVLTFSFNETSGKMCMASVSLPDERN